MDRRLDKNKGFMADAFEKALIEANLNNQDPNFDRFAMAEDYKKTRGRNYNYYPEGGDMRSPEAIWPRMPGSSDSGDPYASKIKPNNPVWDHVPATPQEEAIYYGVHIHSQTNPLGLHTHIPGGKPGGAHLHTPGQNPFGVHHHRDVDPSQITNTTGFTLDGDHTHEPGENKPCGAHIHKLPSNFG